MVYGYARVSTKSQLNNGNSLESQRNALIESGCQAVVEEGYTGTKIGRPKFSKLLEQLQPGDTLVVTKLDRFARSLSQGSELVKILIDKQIKVNILNIGMMDNSPASKLIKNIFFAFAEFERDMIVERTQEGKAIARNNEGFREGRPKKYTETQIGMAINLLNNHSYAEVERMTQISRSTLIRAKKSMKGNN